MKARWLVLVALVLQMAAAHAEQLVRADGYVVHYAAILSRDLTPEIARQFGVVRSANRGLLVLNAQREAAGGPPIPLPATATGTARSLLGHVQELELEPAREGDVHYVLAEFQMLNQEYLIFELQVTPQGASRPLAIKFTQQFYTDGP